MAFLDRHGLEDGGGAFAKAVGGAALFTAAATFALLTADGATTMDGALLAGLTAFFVAVIVVGLSAGALGLPLTRMLERYRLERSWVYPVAGFVLGVSVLSGLLIATESLRSGTVAELLLFAPVGALPGSICGAIWWWVHRRKVRNSGEYRG
jgi:hypothetical protein